MGSSRRSLALLAFVGQAMATHVSAQVRAGAEFRVNAYTTENEQAPAVAFGSAGNFVVAWTSFPICPPPPASCTGMGQDGDGGGIFLRRFDAEGAALGGDQQVNVWTTSTQWRPAIARLSDRRFVVVWETMGNPSARFAGRLLDASGIPFGGEFPVSQDFSGAYPGVAAMRDGFIVVWKPPNDGPVSGRRFDNHGVPRAPAFVVGGSTGTSGAARVAADRDGNFVVAWTDIDGDGTGVRARRFDAAGIPRGPEFVVNTQTAGFQNDPDVAMNGEGRFTVAWRSFGQGVYARRFGADGAALGPEAQVSAATTFALSPSLAMTDDGSVVVTWLADRDVLSGLPTSIKGRRYDRSGLGFSEVRVDSATTFNKLSPALALDAVGNALVSWSSLGQDGSESGVFAQRFGGLLPAGMTVDAVAQPTS